MICFEENPLEYNLTPHYGHATLDWAMGVSDAQSPY